MNNIKKGDFVARKSHKKDVIFIVDMVIKNKIAILSGITTRLKADSYLDDLEIVNKWVKCADLCFELNHCKPSDIGTQKR